MLAASVSLLLAACTGSGTGTPGSGAISSAPVSEAFVLRASNAGPITGQTRFSQSEIGRLYPGKRLQTTRIADDQRTFHALSVYHNDLQTIAIEPTSDNARIKAVHGLGPDVSGPNGERIGMRFGALRVNPANCRVGQNLWRGMPICTAAGTSNVLLVFNPGQPDLAEQVRMPPRNVLQQASLQRIVWLPG
ncbi:MAG: hypothetical protein AAGD23_08845 [Pseudomonadota bacterium]